MAPELVIDPEIRLAWTLPSEVYREPRYLDLARERAFARGWQLVGNLGRLKSPGHVLPVTLLEGFLDEPLLLTRDADDRVRCLSNVCTHRGNLLVEGEGHAGGSMRCRYHGRRFGLDGRCLSMPEFEAVEGFPSAADHLPELPSGAWGPFLFASVHAPGCSLDDLIGPMRDRLAWLPLEDLLFEPAASRDYLVRANWALYVDNYLEGFHIPYVHADLSAALDYGAYRTELFTHSSLQLGIAAGGEEAFDLPASSPDYGQQVAAYYWWLFPNTMFNFYPWGLSINVVVPLAPDRTKVSYLTYVRDPSRRDRGAGAALDRVERQDEEVVEAVQRGVRSRLYRAGRYSPAREPGVHHFHRLLAAALAEGT